MATETNLGRAGGIRIRFRVSAELLGRLRTLSRDHARGKYTTYGRVLLARAVEEQEAIDDLKVAPATPVAANPLN